eukprot:COSAG02_NODE_55176_length_292_cov_0.575130_1_plen_20_part_01
MLAAPARRVDEPCVKSGVMQ